MRNLNILIIDDEINLVRSLAFTLRQTGFECREAHNGRVGCQLAEKEQPDVVLLDIRMPGMNGLEVLEWFRTELPDVPVIMMSAFDDTQDAVTAMKMGAVDYVAKPFDVDELILLLKETETRRRLDSEVRYLRERTTDFDFIGNSVGIKQLRADIDRIAESNAQTILLRGETGVGKAVVARELHRKISAEDAPFVEVNCATLPERQIDLELFGAERGSQPGHFMRQRGLVDIADGGTLFLDEIGEMPTAVQAKLLHFLETHTYRVPGQKTERRVDVRVVAATNKDLARAVEESQFRQDLFFRLNVVPLDIPPLRTREKDIELLAMYFAARFARTSSGKPISFEGRTRDFFQSYAWPGNVRELKNLIERLSIIYPGEVITVDLLPTEIQMVKPQDALSIEESMETVERDLIREALMRCSGKKGLAAERLGISRHALKRKMHRLGLS
ncbi:sigma-54 dependent transcriptional regulator [Sulfitobacter sp. G21635-S1]|uniref:sigma-54-dependent transcriptional regulator n=1 Tax=Sulfitobacter sp. G21635-S1 TaxID=3014043 RepID=UPI0022AF7466|nr:sigma-54 dependent transcriptional regulator [Sulfitobacter sp. G21635-S1]MCZ4255482.1 sigma-54 dependent transcriptional regulator [Sulfitobacter sp. G21635-S1]